jgi:hypothetical protein
MDVIVVHGGDKVGVREIKLGREGREQARLGAKEEKESWAPQSDPWKRTPDLLYCLLLCSSALYTKHASSMVKSCTFKQQTVSFLVKILVRTRKIFNSPWTYVVHAGAVDGCLFFFAAHTASCLCFHTPQ